jgi:hypothetical protein
MIQRWFAALAVILLVCTSLSESESVVTYYFAGDLANCVPNQGNVLEGAFGHEYVGRLLKSLELDGIYRLFLPPGDLAYFKGSESEFRNCYDPVFSTFLPFTRPTPGNHEYETEGAAGYFAYFASVPDVAKGYYSWNLPGGYWHVVSWNSNFAGTERQIALAWLAEDMRANADRPCTLVYMHYPRYSSGEAGNVIPPHDAFEVVYRFRGDIVVSGHDHDYERFREQDDDEHFVENGVTQFVVGTGGAPLRQRVSIRPNSMVFDNTSWGVLALTLGPGTYQFEFLPATGTFTDSGEGFCH